MSRRRLAIGAVAAVLLVLFGGRWFALRFTEYAWHAELGDADRYLRLLWRSLAWRAAAFAAALAWYGANLYAVYRSIGSVQLPHRLGNIEISEAVPPRILRLLVVVTSAALATATAWTFGDLDQYVALWRHAVPLGLDDPVLGKDASFYVARLPLLEVIHLYATLAFTFGWILVLVLYALTGSLTVERRRARITPHARTHLVLLLAVLALAVAWGFQLDGWQLVAGGGDDGGALSAVDRGVRLPASNALALLALVVAAGTALTMRLARTTPVLVLWATLGIAALLGRWAVPAMTDAWGQGSRPLATALAEHADRNTRYAFGILGLDSRTLPLASRGVDADPATALAGVVPWSGEPGWLEAALRQAAGDTAGINDYAVAVVPQGGTRERPAVLAVAQRDPLAASRLVPRLGWTASHREAAAWGSGPVVVDASLQAGPLRFLPAPRTERIRFLAGASELAIVGPDEAVIGRPAPGVPLRSPLRRLLLAWALQSPPLLSDRTSPADRVLYWRDVHARIGRLYAFAAFDPAYPVLVRGRLLWVADGYLVSPRFPLARRIPWGGEDVNWVRPAYVATVDAGSGETRLHLRREGGAIARAVANAEGVEPLPFAAMDPELASQLGYPAGLFGAQVAALALLGPDASEGGWLPAIGDTAAQRRDAALLRPTLARLALEGGAPALWRLAPLTDAAGSRTEGILAGTTGPDGAPRLRLLRAGEPGIPTPQAVAARLLVSPAVAAAGVVAGSEDNVRRGPIHVVPVAGGVACVQVLFTALPGGGAFLPMAVVVAIGSRVGVGIDAAGAVRALERGDDDGTGGAQGSRALAEARAAFAALDSARRAGDWGAFGRAWEALRRALESGTPPPAGRP